MEGVLSFSELEWATLQTVAYADIFDYPLTLVEIQRYLTKCTYSLDKLKLTTNKLQPNYLSEHDGLFCLSGRESIIETRLRRSKIANNLWPKAQLYGKWIGAVPFVRMVAVTGSLAVNNTEANSDIDYMVVTKPQYLWLCRLFIIGLVKWIQWNYHDTICPNYLITENVLSIPEHDLFVARELVQMVPVYGLDVYQRIRHINEWSEAYFPNAKDAPVDRITSLSKAAQLRKQGAERLFQNPLGRWIDRWEMKRKIRKLTQSDNHQDEVEFSSDYCKGHFDGHKQRTFTAFNYRLQAIKDKQKNTVTVNSS